MLPHARAATPAGTDGSTRQVRPAAAAGPADPAGWAIAGIAFVAYLAVGWLRLRNQWATALDLGIFDQGVWLLSEGRVPRLTVIDDNLFGDHFSPVLVTFAPLYRLVATPVWLIAVQAAALALTVVPMRRLARLLGADPRLAAAAVLASAPLMAAATYDFHPVVLTVPVVTWALIAALTDDVRAVTIAVTLVGLIRADAAVALLGVAVLATPRVRRRILLLTPIPLAVGVIVPLLLGSQQTFERHWGNLGSSPAEAAMHPWRLIGALGTTQTLATVAIWLLPVGFLVVGRARWAAALAVAGAPLLLSDGAAVAMPWFHHAATMVPFTIGGALAAIASASDARIRTAASGLLVAGLLLALTITSPLSPTAPASVRLTAVVTPRDAPGLAEALRSVDPGDAVSADSWILVQLTQRPYAYQFPCPLRSLDGVRCGAPDRSPAADVIITSTDRTDALVEAGWSVEPMPGDTIVVARRP